MTKKSNTTSITQSATYNCLHPKLFFSSTQVIQRTQDESRCPSLHLDTVQHGASFSIDHEEELRSKGFDTQFLERSIPTGQGRRPPPSRLGTRILHGPSICRDTIPSRICVLTVKLAVGSHRHVFDLVKDPRLKRRFNWASVALREGCNVRNRRTETDIQ